METSKSRGHRIVTNHGLISNILPSLNLVDQVSLGALCKRSYEITVPWNLSKVKMPAQEYNNFPLINNITSDFRCKQVEATIEGEIGKFNGSVSNLDNLPSGYGVFETKLWVHCGRVHNGCFTDGKKVSVGKKKGHLILVD